jgi:hypothetical protein
MVESLIKCYYLRLLGAFLQWMPLGLQLVPLLLDAEQRLRSNLAATQTFAFSAYRPFPVHSLDNHSTRKE